MRQLFFSLPDRGVRSCSADWLVAIRHDGSRSLEMRFESAHLPVDRFEVVPEFKIGELEPLQRLVQLGWNGGEGS
jgi:hypothetical protein